MFEETFEESMLDAHRKLIIHCPVKDLAEDLMGVFERNGIMWRDGTLPTLETHWERNAEGTCYFVESRTLTYGGAQYIGRDEYSEHIRCTFCGVNAGDFDVASEDEILSLFTLN